MPSTNELAGSKRLDWLRRQHDQAMADVQAITDRAADEDRDLSDAEQATCEARRSRITSLDDDIKVEADLAKRSNDYNSLVENIGPPSPGSTSQAVVRSEPDPAPVYGSPGAYLVDYLTRSDDGDARDRFDRYLKRAVAHQTTAQNPGLLPTPILGPVFMQATARRPAVEASTRRPLPGSGKTFQRPRITQHTNVGPQATEKTELVSRNMTIDPITVTKTTYGGAVNLSWQDRDWTDPAIMDLLVSDLAAMYADTTDAAFCTYFKAQVAGNTETVPSADGEGWLGAIYAAAGTVFGAVNALPGVLWVSPDVWGSLGAMVDGNGRPLFPTVNPVNALGQASPSSFTGNVAGMSLVVDKNLGTGTAILGDPAFVETYETVGGQVSAMEPSVLGTTLAFYGYMAWLVLEADAFVTLTIPPVIPLGAGTTGGNGGTETKSDYAASSGTRAAK